MIHPDDQERLSALRIQAFEKGIPYEVEFQNVRKDGNVSYIYSRR